MIFATARRANENRAATGPLSWDVSSVIDVLCAKARALPRRYYPERNSDIQRRAIVQHALGFVREPAVLAVENEAASEPGWRVDTLSRMDDDAPRVPWRTGYLHAGPQREDDSATRAAMQERKDFVEPVRPMDQRYAPLGSHHGQGEFDPGGKPGLALDGGLGMHGRGAQVRALRRHIGRVGHDLRERPRLQGDGRIEQVPAVDHNPVGQAVQPDIFLRQQRQRWLEFQPDDMRRRHALGVAERRGADAAAYVERRASHAFRHSRGQQHWIDRQVLGIEPAANVAEVAIEKGVPSVVKFMGRETAAEIASDHGKADLLLGNNVLAHVPDLNDFVGGMKILLADHGVITMEFPHLQQLMSLNQFDTIYHEHFSYFSFYTVEKVFAAHGIVLFDVDELGTHGGSLRIYGRHEGDGSKPVTDRVEALRQREIDAGMTGLAAYRKFAEQVRETKRKLLEFLIGAKRAGKSVVGYGAPGKGNTLLNYCGIRQDFLDYTVDRNPYKQGKFTPGTRIPIYDPSRISETKPDYILILPWNLKDEICQQMSFVREWGGQFVVPIPEVKIIT